MTQLLTGLERPGKLEIRLENKSHFLSTNLPYVVRNAYHAVVRAGRVGSVSRLDLPPGLYSVSVVAPDGRQVTRLVQVTAETATPLLLHGDELTHVSAEDLALEDVAAHPDPNPFDAVFAGPEDDAVALLAVERCEPQEDKDGWTFRPEPNPDAVATAEFAVGPERWVVSLPVNPRGRAPDETTCRVVPEFDAGRTAYGCGSGTSDGSAAWSTACCATTRSGPPWRSSTPPPTSFSRSTRTRPVRRSGV